MNAPEQLVTELADRYEIEREIGAGGMANVYLARDVRHHRRVALKVLKPELGAVLGPERFLSEIRVTANLQHPNLLPLFDSGEARGLLYYVMPFIDGESLRARLDREKQLPVEEAVRLATSIASALDYAHRHGVIHRDLKPENVLLQEGQPLVTDFGIALAVSNAGGGRITQTGLSLGTPQYMSPEQATGDRSIDGRTDIYSLGAMLYEMLAGDPPYHASTSQAIIAKVITENVPDVRIARPSVPENVALGVTGALEKLPADRWSTAAEFADAIQGRSIIRRPNARTTVVEYAPLGASRAKTLTIAAALVAAGGLIGIATWNGTHRPPTPPTMRFEVKMPANAVLANAFGSTMALTPDGQSLVYVGRGSITTALYRRRTADLSPSLISGTDTAMMPAVSPDGRWVAFLTNTTIKKVPIDGGVSTPVANIRPEGFSWGKGDRIVFGSSKNYEALQIVSARGGDPEPLTKVDKAHGEIGQRWPVILDDGNTVLYTSWRGENQNARIGVASIKTGESKTLDLAGTFPFAYINGEVVFARADGAIVSVPVDLDKGEVTGDPVILASGVILGARGPAKAALTKSGTLIYAAGSPGTRMIIADTLGHPVAAVAEIGALTGWNQPRFSPDGRKVAVSATTGGYADIWVYDLVNKTRLRLTPTDSTSEGIPSWSPDGKRIMYMTALKDGGSTLSLQAADGSGEPEERLRFSAKQGRAIAVFTPDGRAVVYRILRAPNEAQLWVHSLEGDSTSHLLVNVGTGGQDPGISPDGRWLAYSSDESGTEEVYVASFPAPTARWPISSGGGTAPQWAKNGRAIYYVAPGLRLTRANLNTTNGVAVLSRDSLFTTGTALGRPSREFDLSPDGKHFLFSTPLDTTNTVIAVLNWRTEAMKKALGRAGNDQ